MKLIFNEFLFEMLIGMACYVQFYKHDLKFAVIKMHPMPAITRRGCCSVVVGMHIYSVRLQYSE
jgi:hypothetical protein